MSHRRSAPFPVRSQSVFVALIVVLVTLWGVPHRGAPEDSAPIAKSTEPSSLPVATIPILGTTPFSTAAPTLPPEPSPTPSPTAIPTPTERPLPPATGQATSLIVERSLSDRHEVAFTFDAGEGAGHTAEILDLLAAYGVHGTFGVTGKWVRENPELTRRIVDDGHMLINHTWDHQSFTGYSTGLEPLSDAERRAEILDTESAIIEATNGYRSLPYFRFPYGDYDRAALELLGELGYSYTLGWSCDTQGWNGLSPDQIVELCGVDSDRGGLGAIILMHVADDNDWGALETLLRNYLDAGVQAVTVEQLIQP